MLPHDGISRDEGCFEKINHALVMFGPHGFVRAGAEVNDFDLYQLRLFSGLV
jgi:hypothetical protein